MQDPHLERREWEWFDGLDGAGLGVCAISYLSVLLA